VGNAEPEEDSDEELGSSELDEELGSSELDEELGSSCLLRLMSKS
jgi:hypothetical protein